MEPVEPSLAFTENDFCLSAADTKRVLNALFGRFMKATGDELRFYTCTNMDAGSRSPRKTPNVAIRAGSRPEADFVTWMTLLLTGGENVVSLVQRQIAKHAVSLMDAEVEFPKFETIEEFCLLMVSSFAKDDSSGLSAKLGQMEDPEARKRLMRLHDKECTKCKNVVVVTLKSVFTFYSLMSVAHLF